MNNQIQVVLTADDCDNYTGVKGTYYNNELYIDIMCIPESIYISTNKLFSANEGERCLSLLHEKLCTCKGLPVGVYMKYHHHSLKDYIIGGLNKGALDQCFKEMCYYIKYSLHKLN